MSIQFLTELLQYDKLSSFKEGLCAVCKNDLWGFIDNTGKEVIATQYESVGDFCEGFAYAKNNNGKWIFIDKNGHNTFGVQFDEILTNFLYGLAEVRIKGEKGIVDTTGKAYRKPEHLHSDFINGLAVKRMGNKWGYVDKTGELAIPELYEFCNPFYSGNYAQVSVKGLLGTTDKLIDKQGNIIFPTKKSKIDLIVKASRSFSYNNNRILVRSGSDFKIIDTHENTIVKYGEYDRIVFPTLNCIPTENLVPVRKNNKWGFVDINNGNLTIPLKYDYCFSFSDGLALVQKGNWQGFIDKSGKVIIDNYQYDTFDNNYVYYFRNGFLSTAEKINESKSKFGLMDKTGKELLAPEYDEEIFINERIGKIKKGSQSGFVYLYPTSNGAVPICCFEHFNSNGIAEIIIDRTKVKINRNGQLLNDNNGYIHPEILADFNSRSPSYHQNNDNYKNDNFKGNDSKVENFQQKLNIPLSDIPLWIEIFPKLEQYPVDELEKFLLQQREIHCEHCEYLKKLPESIGQLQNLQELVLGGCKSLTTLPESIGQLQNLQVLDLERCKNLTTLPESIGQLQNLQKLDLGNCEKLTTLPESIGQLQNLQELNLEWCVNLTTLPESVGQLQNLQELNLEWCIDLTTLPESIGQLQQLQILDLSSCKNLTTLPESIIGRLQNLQELNLGDCKNLTTLPKSIGQLQNLQKLWLYNCKNLITLPESIGQLQQLQILNLSSCENLTRLPESISLLKNCEIIK